jgi:hypothetical protein
MAEERRTKFRTIDLAPAPFSTDELRMDPMERAVAKEEVGGYEFHSLTLVGVFDGNLRFIAAFRKRESP